nr:hypothetical protein [Actinomycetota bacterium]
KREEEAAIEESKAFSRYEGEGDGLTAPAYLPGLALILALALAGATVRGGPGHRPAAATASAVRTQRSRR